MTPITRAPLVSAPLATSMVAGRLKPRRNSGDDFQRSHRTPGGVPLHRDQHCGTVPIVFAVLVTAYCVLGSVTRADETALPSDPRELVDPATIPRYQALRTTSTITIDGKLDESDWRAAPRTRRFVDLISGGETIHDTRAAILWDSERLYIGFWVEEPFVRAKFTERDALIYQDNDIEVFIAGQDVYYEFEANALGTIYEVLFIWEEAYDRDGYAAIPGLRRADPGVREFLGVGFKNHPRGKRIGCFAWDFPGLASAGHVDGTLNDDSDRDRGWTFELALPWRGMELLAKGDQRALPPRDGDIWRLDLFRFNQYREAKPARDSSGWAFGCHGVWDSHVPEIFPYVQFTKRPVAP